MRAVDRATAVAAEEARAAALVDLCRAAPDKVAEAHGVRTQAFGAASAVCAPRWSATHVNRVIGLGMRAPATEPILDRIGAFFHLTRTRFVIQLCPAARPDALRTWLFARGYAHAPAGAVVVREPSAPPLARTDLHVEEVGQEQAATFADLLVMAFDTPPFFEPWLEATVGRPGWRHYLALDGRRPVAAAAMFVAGEVALLQFSATLAPFRGRGAQSALIARRIQDARDIGCRLLVSETDSPDQPGRSFRNLKRAGFRVHYVQENYYSPETR